MTLLRSEELLSIVERAFPVTDAFFVAAPALEAWGLLLVAAVGLVGDTVVE